MIVALAGGGGAKLAQGRYLGLRISPDLDTVLYTLAGLANPVMDWGLAGDSTRTFDLLQATTWEALLAAHDRWVADLNWQDHSAHRRRPELRSPQAVLYQVCGRLFDPEDLHRVFAHARWGRVVDQAGFVRFRHWRRYGERGLTGERVAVWPCAERQRLVFRDEPLAQYRVTYQAAKRRRKTVAEERRFDTPHRSPQPPLWAWGADEWLRVLRLSAYAPRRRPTSDQCQAPLFALEGTG